MEPLIEAGIEGAELGPDEWIAALVADAGIAIACKLLGVGCDKLCDQTVGVITHNIADKLTDMACDGAEDLFHRFLLEEEGRREDDAPRVESGTRGSGAGANL